MDFVYLGVVAVLWVAMVGMTFGCARLLEGPKQ